MTKSIPKVSRVLVVGPYPPPNAGPELAIKSLLESPFKDRFRLSHLSTNVRKNNASKGKVGFGLVTAFIGFCWRLTMRLIGFRPHVVYYFVTATRMGWLGRDIWCIAIARLFGAKVITHMRAGHFKHNLKSASRLEWWIIKWACHRVSWSLVQCDSLKNQFEDLAPVDRIGVVHNMIDVEKYKAVNADEYKKNAILFMGHLSEAKGYCELLKVIPTVVAKHPDIEFQFAGTKLAVERNVKHSQSTGEALPGESPDDCFEKHVAGKFEKNHVYLGMLDEQQKLVTLRQCNFLVLPSYSEGFSMAVLEAITSGKPVVSTRVGAMQDVLETGRNGELIDAGDTEGLAKAILRLLDNSAYRCQVAKENASYSRKNFSQNVIADRLGDFVETALSGVKSVTQVQSSSQQKAQSD